MAVRAAGTFDAVEAGWRPPTLDSPRRRQPLTALVETAALPHRRLTAALAGFEGVAVTATRQLLETSDPARAVRLVAGITAIHSAFSCSRTSVGRAVEWFGGPEIEQQAELHAICWDTAPDDALTAMLPYVLDPYGLTTRRALLAGRACAVERGKRKATGTFYTPGDVARHLSDCVITGESRRVIDPTCGAGVFLRSAFTRLCERLPARVSVKCLFGIDADPAAVDACALVLLHDWLKREPLGRGEWPRDRFFEIRANLKAADALRFAADREQLSLFDGADRNGSFPERFDVVLMNPPFAPLGSASKAVVNAFQSLKAASDPARVNMVWPFWELAAKLGGLNGQVGVVLPLSVAYLSSPVARAARRAVLFNADWEFSFFDRTPDALFGDDVKQRVALAIRHASGRAAIRTSALRRWSADRRQDALAQTPSVTRPPDDGIILKIGTAAEKRAVAILRRNGACLGSSLVSARLVAQNELDQSSSALAVAPTAYNWIGVYRDTQVAARARAAATGQFAELRLGSDVAADALYAILVSHVFLWWWRVTGDLFHVPLAWLRQSPFALNGTTREDADRLGQAGRACWDEAQRTPIVSTNRGVTVVSYKPPDDSLALVRADDAVGRAFGLDQRFVRFTRDDARRLRIAGRDA